VNFIEAVRSERPFRRKEMHKWFMYGGGEIIDVIDGSRLDTSSVETLDSLFFCDDWELMPGEDLLQFIMANKRKR